MMFKTTYLTKLTDVDTTDREGVGTLRLESNKLYKYVKYDDGTGDLDVVAGDVVGYLAASNTFVTADVTDMDVQPVMAGAMVAAVTATDQYCWIQIGGAVTLAATVTGTTPAAGDVINMSASDKKAKVDPVANETLGGYMRNATTGAYLNCPW